MQFLVALASVFALAVANPLEPFILNGQMAKLGQFPWMAKIEGCSASVVNARTIVTAAHCVCNRAPAVVEVGAIRSDVGQGARYKIVRTLIHPGYPTGRECAIVREFDLAVLKTDRDIAFNNNVKPIPLYLAAAEPQPGARIFSMGYGGDHKGVNDVLNFAGTTLTRKDCSGAYFCSARRPNSIYFGDSGGPMVIQVGGKFFQLGVNSGISDTNSLYANIPRFQSFIKKYL